ncbi:sugar ABC transporter substrate-binding protein [Egicoccus halophilus]|uniref:Sugar ABC transporter substrate-binding protein n=1 Tax=Egicoccus halophilus TaxID=1670830 RepID=A0A8J3A624_9ACTN|nr:sugar ABC transporter substrate-binding protein [Egicoccus halophilus]
MPAAALVLTACGNGTEEPTTTEDPAEDTAEPTTEDTEEPTDEEPAEPEPDEGAEEEGEEIARADADLVIWADDTRAPILEPLAEEFGEAEGISVAVQEVPFDQIRDLVSVQGPAGQGPDVFIGAHDWLGELAENGVVEPLDLGGAEGDYLEVATQAFSYDGTNYGLPYSIENIALVRNTELAPEAAETLEDMVEVGTSAVDAGDADLPVAWQQDPGDPFHNYWVVTGAGGYVFGQQDDGSYDAEDVGIDSEGGLRAAEIFGELAEQGVVNSDVTYDVMIDTFASGRAPFAVTGPWALPDFGDVDYVVEPLPSVDGNPAGPFVGVQGVMVSAFAENSLAATTFVLDYLGQEEVQLELYEAGGRPPALQSAFDAVSDDPDVAGFGAAGETGRPMPAIPEMGAVWTAWTDAYQNIFAGNDPEAAFEEAAEQIRNTIDAG